MYQQEELRKATVLMLNVKTEDLRNLLGLEMGELQLI